MKRLNIKVLSDVISGKDGIILDDIPKPYRQDLVNFIYGFTFSRFRNGKPVVGLNLYRNWLRKLWVKGFDYDVDERIYD